MTPRYYQLLDKGKALRMYQAQRSEYAFNREYFEIQRGGITEKALRETTDMLARIVAALDEAGIKIDPTGGQGVRARLAQNAALLDQG